MTTHQKHESERPMTSTSDEVGHTATPWSVHVEVEQHGMYRGSSSVYICSDAGWPEGQIARVNVQDEFRAREANAAFIVNAVNSHDSLVKALECFLGDPRFQVAVGGNPIVVDRMLSEARAALSQAKGVR